jgi:hypothetical protein
MHGELCPKTAKPAPLRGRGAKQLGGGSQPISNHIEIPHNRYRPNQQPNLYGANENGESQKISTQITAA